MSDWKIGFVDNPIAHFFILSIAYSLYSNRFSLFQQTLIFRSPKLIYVLISFFDFFNLEMVLLLYVNLFFKNPRVVTVSHVSKNNDVKKI